MSGEERCDVGDVVDDKTRLLINGHPIPSISPPTTTVYAHMRDNCPRDSEALRQEADLLWLCCHPF